MSLATVPLIVITRLDPAWRTLTCERLVIATGETHTVKEFVEEAFSYVGLNWKDHVRIDPHYFRPTEVDLLVGDASKARKALGWSPRVKFKELVRLMVDADVEALKHAGKPWIDTVNWA